MLVCQGYFASSHKIQYTMFKPVRWLMVFLFPLLSCSKEDNLVTPHELLSAHTWVSKNYVFEDVPTSTFNWDCLFSQIKEFFEVSNVVGNSECFFNDQPLRSNRQYGIDFVFKPK